MDDATTEVKARVPASCKASLYHSYRWCGYGWVSVAVGLVLRHDPMSIIWPIGGSFVIGGLFFAFIGCALAILGFVIPGGCPRRFFAGPLLASLPPLVFPVWLLLAT